MSEPMSEERFAQLRSIAAERRYDLEFEELLAEVDRLKRENAKLRAAYRLDGAPWFRKNCRRQRCVGAKICQECPFRAGIEAAEAARERSEG